MAPLATVAAPSRRTLLALGAWIVVVGIVGGLSAGTSSGSPSSSSVAGNPLVPPNRLVALPASEAVVLATTTEAPDVTSPAVSAPGTTSTTAAPVTPPPVPSSPSPTASPAPAPPTPATAPAAVDGSGEQQILDDHNRRRSAEGLPPLRRHACLDDVARGWSDHLATTQNLAHNPSLSTAVSRCLAWTGAAENVGHAGTIGALLEKWWGSSPHRANITGRHHYVGVGVSVDAEGGEWASVVFVSV